MPHIFDDEDNANKAKSAKDVDQEKIQAFLEELTNLTRKHLLEVSSAGEISVPTVQQCAFERAHSGRYTLFWSDQEGDANVQTPVDIYFTPDAALENVIHFDDEE